MFTGRSTSTRAVGVVLLPALRALPGWPLVKCEAFLPFYEVRSARVVWRLETPLLLRKAPLFFSIQEHHQPTVLNNYNSTNIKG